MKEPELRLKNKLERENVDWREVDRQINKLVKEHNKWQ